MDFNTNLTDEQKEKIRACETPEDILALAKEEGYDLSEEELDMISGGDTHWNCGGNHSAYVYVTK